MPIEESFRRDAGHALATLACALRDLDSAEDAVQEAYVAALQTWPRDGVPANPAAWIVTTARNRAIDRVRREQRATVKHEQLARLETATAALPEIELNESVDAALDDRLGLIFACCHPSLNQEARVALTLHALGGLTTEEIATAFLVPLPTMAQRLVRAKRKIREAGIPFGVPAPDLLAERVDAVATVVYLIFNEGYAATSGEARVRTDLMSEAIRLARLLARLMPDQPELHGLLALMLLHHSRHATRENANGEIVTLEDQDRSLWNRTEIDEGLAALANAGPLQNAGPYHIQAVIAAAHAVASSAQTTDWRSIAHLYGDLAEITPSPVIELNRAVAVAMGDSLEGGLAIVEQLEAEGTLPGYYLLHATKADLLRRLGRYGEAALAYGRAMDRTRNAAERRFFAKRYGACRELEIAPATSP